MQVQRGCLLLADISGYSRYLAAVELEHSHDILADLLTTVVSQLAEPFQLSKLEGDAVFCYVSETEEGGGAHLVPMLEECYFAFQRRLRNISHLSTCDCNACVTVPRLSLKFVVHHGEFVVHQVVGRPELVGSDVIVVHRMLKNSVKETTGLEGYALYSGACIKRLDVDWRSHNMRPHTEMFDDVGEVESFLQDLEARWREEIEQRAFYLAPGEVGFEVSADLPAAPEAIWEIATSSSKRPLWQPDVLRIDRIDTNDELGVGTVNHCVHGNYAVREEIIDWKPYQYYSLRWLGPYGPLVGTIEFAPLQQGCTRVTVRMDPETRALGREEFANATTGLREPYEKGLLALGALAKTTAHSRQPK